MGSKFKENQFLFASPERIGSNPRLPWQHLYAYAVFFIIAVFATLFTMHLGELRSGDMRIYITLANAVAFPDLFKHSIAFADIDRYGFWAYTLTPTLIRISIEWFGSYKFAIYALSFFNIFFLMAGFYAFCGLYCKTRWAAILNTILLLIPIKINSSATYWGLFNNALPRGTALCFFIWILFFAFKSRFRPKYWPAIMVCQGLLIFVHPISAFSTALGIWCAFIPFIPTHWSIKKKIAWMILCGLCFLISAFPSYLGLLRSDNTAIPYSIWLEIRTLRMTWLTFYQGLGFFIFQFFIKLPIIPAGLVLAYWSWKNGNDNDRQMLKFIFGFAVGILATVFLYFAYHHFFAAIERIPPQTELIRAMRFLIFIALFCIAFGLHNRLQNWGKVNYTAILIAVILGIGALGNLAEFSRQLYMGATYLFPKTQSLGEKNHDYMELIKFAAETKPNSSFMGNIDLLPLRNKALRPLAYSFKDGALLLISHHQVLSSWSHAARNLSPYNPTPEPIPDPSKFIRGVSLSFDSAINTINRLKTKFKTDVASRGKTLSHAHFSDPGLELWYSEAVRLGADYLVIKKEKTLKPGEVISYNIAWENRTYIVISVQKQ